MQFPLRAPLLFCFLASCGGETAVGRSDGSAPVGNLRVIWRIADAQGKALTCDDVRTDAVEVRIGGAPTTATCDAGFVLLEHLLADRYPVRVALRFGGALLAEGAANADVIADQETTVEVPITVNQGNGNLGNIEVRWRIDDRPAGTRCLELGASTVVIDAREGSTDETLSVEATCSDGAVTILDVQPGGYTLRLRLETPTGDVITSNLTEPFAVREAQTAKPATVPLTTMLPELGSIRAEWTLNSTTATTACSALGSAARVLMNVRMVDERQGHTRLEGTVTATCSAGHSTLRRLLSNVYSVELILKDATGTRTSTTIRGVAVALGRTSTVSVDLRLD